MISNMFSHVDLLERALDAGSLRQQVIAQNIANADTPNYKAERVDFEERFRAALNGTGIGIEGKRTSEKHFEFGSSSSPLGVTPVVVKDTHYTMRMDGNNVDADLQFVEEAKNTIMMNTIMTELNSEFARLRMAIREAK